ncbi:MAG: ABC transporter permease [Anaerolineae bacterium]
MSEEEFEDLTFFEPLERKQTIEAPLRKSPSYWKDGWTRLKKSRTAMGGLIFLTLLLFMAIIGPFLSPYPYYETHLPLKNTPPCKQFWFGTDELGRDMFTRVWWGARISLFVGITASLIDLCLGVFYGAVAAMSKGRRQEWMMRAADILNSIPQLLVVILLMVIIGSGLMTIVIALTMIGWIGMARVVRAEILRLSSLDFIKSAEAIGASRTRILFRHLIPNALGPIIITVTFTIPTAIFSEAFLSFLGLGVQAPIASWGTMASDGLSALRYYPWRLFFPAGFISVTMLSFNLLGDGLRDAFDPRLHL